MSTVVTPGTRASESRLPNLFVIGAMKSGTTSLHEYLGEHPDIFMTASRQKEPAFFVEEKNWSRGMDWYLELFAGAGEERYRGESSTQYTMLPRYRGVPERIAQLAAEPRFIYVMREPAARTVSHYWHSVRWYGESRDLRTAIEHNRSLLDFSNYAMQLRPYIDRFGRESIFVMTFERLVGDPERAMREIFEWLGVRSDVELTSLHRVHNASPSEIDQPRLGGALDRMRHSRLWERLAPRVPAPVRRLGRTLALRRVAPAKQDHRAVVARIREIQAAQIEALERLLGQRFPEWRE